MPNAEGRMEDTVDTLRARLAVAHDTMKLFCVQPCQWCNGSGAGEVIEDEDGEPERVPCERCQGDGWESLLSIEVSSLREQLRAKADALAAARAENERMREALTHYANAVNWMSHTDADAMLRVWIGSGDGPDYARRALAAQEGTNGH